jgi:microcystin-dependent protein
MSFFKWSKTANANATADGTINWAEGQAPSTVNDSARAMMAAAAKYRDDVAGAITTGGTSTAYTLTTNQVFDSFAHMDGAMLTIVPNATNSGATTLNVDALGPKPLRSAPSVEIGAGVLIQGTPYTVTYFNSTGEWILRSFYGSPLAVPLGAVIPYTGSIAPNANFILPAGQAISRTTYAAYFALVGTTFGSGDGSATFNVPDLRGRALIALDNLNGTPANRITSGGSGIAGTTIGATGGAETVTLATNQIPPHQHSVIGSTAGQSNDHSHGFSWGGTTSSDGDHTHSIPGGGTPSGGANQLSFASDLVGTFTTMSSAGPHVHAYSGSGNTSGVNVDHAHGINLTSGLTGGGAVHNNMPPTIMITYILRIQ